MIAGNDPTNTPHRPFGGGERLFQSKQLKSSYKALGLQCVKVGLKLCTGVALRPIFARIMERVRFTQRLSELYVQTVAVLLLVIYNKLKQSYA